MPGPENKENQLNEGKVAPNSVAQSEVEHQKQIEQLKVTTAEHKNLPATSKENKPKGYQVLGKFTEKVLAEKGISPQGPSQS